MEELAEAGGVVPDPRLSTSRPCPSSRCTIVIDSSDTTVRYPPQAEGEGGAQPGHEAKQDKAHYVLLLAAHAQRFAFSKEGGVLSTKAVNTLIAESDEATAKS